MIANELALQGATLEADVELQGVSSRQVRLPGGAGNDAMTVDGPAFPDAIGKLILDPGTGNDSVTIGGSVTTVKIVNTPGADPRRLRTPGGDDRYVVDSSNPTIGGSLQLGDGNDVATTNASGLTLDGGDRRTTA